jgi:hypothetical protein
VPVEVDVRDTLAVDGLVDASPQLDLLVLGSRASGPPRAVRLGNVSRAVVDRAACPVVLLPRETRHAPSARPAGAGYSGALTTMTGVRASSSKPREVDP